MNDQLLTVLSLLAGGLVLVAAEVFVIPGFGVIGVAGGLTLLLATLLTWFWFGASAAAGAALVSFVGPAVLFAIFAKTAGKKLVLRASLPKTPDSRQTSLTLGQQGRALTPLRPSGTAEFEQQRVDVVTDGLYVAAGEPLRVVEISGARIVVEGITSATDTTRKT
jgi:membrane-bound serine protease (ClpP class)